MSRVPEEPVPQLPAPGDEFDPDVITLSRAALHAREARAYAAGWRDAVAATRSPAARPAPAEPTRRPPGRPAAEGGTP